MRSLFLAKNITSCGVCGVGNIYGARDLQTGLITDQKRGTVTGKRTTYKGLTIWSHYPGPCWLKTLDAPIPDSKKAAANDRD